MGLRLLFHAAVFEGDDDGRAEENNAETRACTSFWDGIGDEGGGKKSEREEKNYTRLTIIINSGTPIYISAVFNNNNIIMCVCVREAAAERACCRVSPYNII